MNIDDIVNVLRENGVRRPKIPGDQWVRPVVFVCSLANDEAGGEECDIAAGGQCPSDLKQFWQRARSGRLFEDTTYGQWGLELLSPEKARHETLEFRRCRPVDSLDKDLVVGRFIGDADILLLRCDPNASDFGEVLVASPIDPRSEWDVIARSFGDFLNRYVETRGDMYWHPEGDKGGR